MRALLQPEILQALVALVQQQIAQGGGDVRQNPEWQRLRGQWAGPRPPGDVALRDLQTLLSRKRERGPREQQIPGYATGIEQHRQEVEEAARQAGQP